jgi:1-phosphofructokinase
MIITVTLNPAEDRFVTVRDFRPGGLNRVLGTQSFSGGKGNNVAGMVRRMGVSCTATGFLSGRTGANIEENLTAAGVECAFIYTPGETRTNIKIIDVGSRICTELNQAGPPATLGDADHLEETVARIARRGDVIVLSGSVPEGIPEDIYARLTRKARSLGALVVLDADGPSLIEGIKASPDAIKPNLHELSGLTGRTLETAEDAAEAVRAMHLAEGRKVLVSMGSHGAMLFSNTSGWFAEAPDVPVRSTVGAGDAMTAAIAVGLLSGQSDEEILRYAGAYAAAVVMSEHFECLTEEYVIGHMDKIRIRRL